jgi:hypothetical protein
MKPKELNQELRRRILSRHVTPVEDSPWRARTDREKSDVGSPLSEIATGHTPGKIVLQVSDEAKG